MPAASQIDMAALSTAICRGLVEGNRPIVDLLSAESGKRHDLRGVVQQNTDKVWELDGELKLIKGWIITLMGNGDGNGGMVNRIDRDMGTLTEDVATLKIQVGDIHKKLDAALSTLSTQRSFMDGWKGVGMALGVIGTCVTIAGGVCACVVWLFQHGVKP